MWRSLELECPIRMAVCAPAEPDADTAWLLRRAFRVPPVTGGQRWLLYLAEGSVEPPERVETAPGPPLRYAGPLDLVDVASHLEEQLLAAPVAARQATERVAVRVRLVADLGWRTMRVLRRLVEVEDRPMQARYVSLVADRFDAAGMRVARLAAAQCVTRSLELEKAPTAPRPAFPVGRRPRSVWVAQVEPQAGMWWWAAPDGGSWLPATGTVTGVVAYQNPAGSYPVSGSALFEGGED